MPVQPQPLYEQIKIYVLDRIADGTFLPGTRIPSENQLAAELGASRLTAHRALRELTVSGVYHWTAETVAAAVSRRDETVRLLSERRKA